MIEVLLILAIAAPLVVLTAEDAARRSRRREARIAELQAILEGPEPRGDSDGALMERGHREAARRELRRLLG